MNQEDYPSLAAILQDEQTMYAYETPFSAEETQAWLDRNLARYKEDGFGLWAVILKDDGTMIGQAGLTWQSIGESSKVLEVGYLFNRSYWGKGYAIEAARACKKYAFAKLNSSEVYSIIRDSNVSSMNVAIRNGMLARGSFIKRYRGMDMPHLIFSAKRKPSIK